MKKLILLLLLVPLSLFSQWSFSEKNDPFDGKYTAVFGSGHNGEFPYEYPRIVFRKRGEEIDIYIGDAGSPTYGQRSRYEVRDNSQLGSFDYSTNVEEYNHNAAVDEAIERGYNQRIEYTIPLKSLQFQE